MFTKKTTVHVHHAFLYISLLYGVGERAQQKNCLFANLDNDRYGPKENFAKICEIKWNWVRSVKFEIVRIDF